MWYVHMSACGNRGQNSVQYPLELELQVEVICLVEVLGTTLMHTGRVVQVVKCSVPDKSGWFNTYGYQALLLIRIYKWTVE